MDERNYAPRHAKRKQEKQMRTRRIITLVVILAIICVVVAVLFKACGNKDVNKDKDTKGKTETSATTTDPNTVVAEAKVLSTGDVLIHKMLLDASVDGSGYSFDKHFRFVTQEITNVDYAVANLEVTLAESGFTCYPTFKTPDAIATALKNAGFDCLVTANNHCYDGSFSGLKRTATKVQELGFDQTGTKKDLDQKDYLVVDVNDIKIGIINYAEETTSSAGRKALNGILLSAEANDYVNSFFSGNLDAFYTEMADQITAMKKDGAEAIILYIHWGVEYSLTPSTMQKNIAQKMCDLGVDVIIGGHPHVIQPAETLTSTTDSSHKTFCVYSVGNLISNQRTAYMGSACTTGHTEDAVFVYTTFTKYGDGRVELSDVSYTPLWVNRYAEGNSYVYEITSLNDLDKVKVNVDAAKSSKERTVALLDEGFKSYSVD